MEEAEDELARLRAENARLRAMIDHLERAGGNEPVPLAANTQIIKREEAIPEPATETRKLARRRRPKPRKKPAKQWGILSWVLLFLLLFMSAIGIVVAWFAMMAFFFTKSAGQFNLWLLIGMNLALDPFILLVVWEVRVSRKERQARNLSPPPPPKKPRERPRRRITRKLRAATTQKLDAE